MDINSKLDQFLKDDNAHAFFVYGPWGVGKTFAINKWLETIKEYKVISLSLFGMSSVNDLNASALKSECFRNKLKAWIKSLNGDTSVSIGPVSVNLPLTGMVSALLHEKHDSNDKYLFFIDDIERKDNELTIEKILGFVDSLPLNNTKVILSANLEKLAGKEGFKGFREKVIQYEYSFNSPTDFAVEEIIGKEYSNRFIKNKYPIKNLRTLQKIKKILSVFPKSIDINLLDCIYYCCLNIYDNYFSREELITNYRKNQLDFINVFESSRDSKNEDESIDKKVESYVNKIEGDINFLCENIKLLNLLDEIRENSLRTFVKSIYEIIKSENYTELVTIDIPSRDAPLKKYDEYGKKVFYSGKPSHEYLLIMQNFYSFFKSPDYDLIDLFRKFYTTILNYGLFVSPNCRGKDLEKRISIECPSLVAKYIFDNSYFENDDINSSLPGMRIPEWILAIEKKIVESYCIIFNKYYMIASKNKQIDLEYLNQRLYLLERVFYTAKIYDNSLFKIDEIMLNAIKYAEGLIKGDMSEDNWSYCHTLVKWIFANNNTFNLSNTIKLILDKSSKSSLSGQRLSILVKTYNLNA